MEGDLTVRRVGLEKPTASSPSGGSDAKQGLKKSLSRLNNLASITSTGDVHTPESSNTQTTRRKVEKRESEQGITHKDTKPMLVVRSSLNDMEAEGVTEKPERMSLQEKIRLGIFLESLGVPQSETAHLTQCIMDKVKREFDEPNHIGNLVKERKLLLSCVGLCQKRIQNLSRDIDVIRVQRVMRGFIDRRRLGRLRVIYTGVDLVARNNTFMEFVDNEADYVRELNVLMSLQQLCSNLVNKQELEKIFSQNLFEIYGKHSSLRVDLDTLVDSFPHITNLASTWLKKTSFLSLYGDYVENINHAETTLRRVWEENSKLRNGVIAYYKEFKITHHAMTSSGGTGSPSALSHAPDKGLLGVSHAYASASSGAGSSSGGFGASSGAGETTSRLGFFATDGGEKRTKNQTKDDIAGEAMEFLLKYLRLPKPRIQYYTGIFTEVLKNTTSFHPDFTQLQIVNATMVKLEELMSAKITSSIQRNAILEISRRLDQSLSVDEHGVTRAFIREDWVQCQAAFNPKGKQIKLLAILFSDMLLFASPIKKDMKDEKDGKLKQLRSFKILPTMWVDVKHPKAIYQKTDKPHSVNLIDSSTKELAASFLCTTQVAQDEWIADLKNVIKGIKLANATVYGVPLLEMIKRVKGEVDMFPYFHQPVRTCPLDTLALLYTPSIPPFMQNMVEYIDNCGLKTSGIYRVSALMEQIDEIRTRVDAFDPLPQSFLEQMQVFAVCDALKLYFRRLPEPLLTFDLYEPVQKMHFSYDEDPDEYANEIRKLFGTLPLINYSITKFLARHLMKVENYCAENLMTTTNLAIVFAPSLLFPREETLEAALTVSKVYAVVACMIDNYETVFQEKPPVEINAESKKKRLSLAIKTSPFSKQSPRLSANSAEAAAIAAMNLSMDNADESTGNVSANSACVTPERKSRRKLSKLDPVDEAKGRPDTASSDAKPTSSALLSAQGLQPQPPSPSSASTSSGTGCATGTGTGSNKARGSSVGAQSETTQIVDHPGTGDTADVELPSTAIHGGQYRSNPCITVEGIAPKDGTPKRAKSEKLKRDRIGVDDTKKDRRGTGRKENESKEGKKEI